MGCRHAEPAPAVRGADKDRDDIQHQTELQERALDGIDSALDDLGVMSKVPPPQTTVRSPSMLSCALQRAYS